MENLLERLLHFLIPLCELMGAAVVAVSVAAAFVRYLRLLITHRPGDVQFRLAAGLALSLEFKMAAEILKTVLIRELLFFIDITTQEILRVRFIEWRKGRVLMASLVE